MLLIRISKLPFVVRTNVASGHYLAQRIDQIASTSRLPSHQLERERVSTCGVFRGGFEEGSMSSVCDQTQPCTYALYTIE
jgi:hypothetical protein